MDDFYEKLFELLRENPKVVIATVIKVKGSTPRMIGTKMAVLPSGEIIGTIGGGGLEQRVTEEASQVFRTGEATTKDYGLVPEEQGGIGTICGGSVEVLFELVSAPERLIICGGGHIGLALSKFAKDMGYEVFVLDDRDDYSKSERFPEGVEAKQSSFDDEALKQLVTSNTSVVILTHDHKHDKDALKNFLPTGALYIGMIGSKKKVKEIFKQLEEGGETPQRLKEVFAPIGLDIGAETPEEIALAILAEMVALKRSERPSPVSLRERSHG